MDWRPRFPYDRPRDIQAEALDVLFREWENYEVFVISAPTAFGKSGVAKTLMNAFHSVSYVTPTNLLVDQFLDEFPDTPTLHRLDSYRCEKWDRPCPITRAKLHQFCNVKRDDCRCPASSDLATAKYQRGPGVYNYHTYVAHQLYRDVICLDECHNSINFLKSRGIERIWQHDYKYPQNMYSYEQILAWVDKLPPNKRKHKKISLLRESVKFQVPTHVVHRTTAEFNGKGTQRGRPEERDCLELIPVDVSDAVPVLWMPGQVKKIVLMSATIGKKDIEQLGLGNRRLLYIDCKSPIPPHHRPIIPLDTVSVNRQSMLSGAVETLAKEINNIADYHVGEKGVIHATYQLASALRHHLDSSRFIFHTREDKAEQYARFRAESPESGAVLVACGMYEGIDLPDDLGRWQVISKIPWASLGNPAIKHMSELDPEWFLWETMKTTIQACGRICRTPEDFGCTYITDSSIHRFFKYGREMLPEWFVAAFDQDWLQRNGYK